MIDLAAIPRPRCATMPKDLQVNMGDLRQIMERNPQAMADVADQAAMTTAQLRTAIENGRIRARHDGRIEVDGKLVLELDR